MQITDLKALFIHELNDVYSAEEQIVDALPMMIEAATHDELREALEEHLEVTQSQIERLDRIGELMGWERDTQEACEGMKGILKEGAKGLEVITDSHTRDAAIIASVQRVEHYEIAVYGTLVEYAKQQELDDVAELLGKNLDEEKDADETLSRIAKGGLFTTGVNKLAEES